jgi:Zn finger protein HypA/HybF involved in hydrogenase expression
MNVRFYYAGLACIFLSALLGAGCHKNAAEESLSSDANGFFCQQCSAKFYTSAGFYADHCPQCKSSDLRPIIGFVCYKDHHTTLTPQGPKSIACEQCQALATGLKMPRESELKAWGAVKKTPAEVGAK